MSGSEHISLTMGTGNIASESSTSASDMLLYNVHLITLTICLHSYQDNIYRLPSPPPPPLPPLLLSCTPPISPTPHLFHPLSSPLPSSHPSPPSLLSLSPSLSLSLSLSPPLTLSLSLSPSNTKHFYHSPLFVPSPADLGPDVPPSESASAWRETAGGSVYNTCPLRQQQWPAE